VDFYQQYRVGILDHFFTLTYFVIIERLKGDVEREYSSRVDISIRPVLTSWADPAVSVSAASPS
jgi:hypothetical protein